jgi:4-hydroxybenzoate polyprenyltransferase
MKPFIVGLTWAGWVTIYPVVIWQVQRNESFDGSLIPLVLLCLQNFLFFSINAIIFDIKDYRTDSYYHLKTYPVIFGVKNTIRFIVLPLIFINLVVFFLFQRQQNFSFWQTSIQLIPYILLVLIVLRYRQGRKVLYYLAAVDGLVFLKAFCGITSILLIKK